MAWANPFKVLKTVNTPKAGWIEGVQGTGESATATVLAKPDAVTEMGKVGHYSGHDPWIDADVRVAATSEPPFEAKAKIPLSTAMGGLVEAGSKVNVRYDPENHDHVVVVDDVQTLLQRRIITP
jgi:hypothetical protein